MGDSDETPEEGSPVEVNPGGTETFWGCPSCQNGNTIDRQTCGQCGWRRGELVDLITGEAIDLEDVERLGPDGTTETYTEYAEGKNGC